MKDSLNDTEYVVNENHLNNVIAEVWLIIRASDRIIEIQKWSPVVQIS